ncbi:Hypothetical protein DEACI_2296 [Acididesulfobacillus acetoxydans]|uniref:Uncharacterized protein n=1 Tax=Acididesulfobacillus acetoxydans TaxID=1561005 RepID=A0A8S0W890_9FIRM|nr:Hypothetical protein DEACI_2296 [Acididesulfobacillus acetoxydans]CEJ07116.1 Hypothetical protein DEACI_1574 [Acididesulfobacillus acetoxydans]
MDDLPLGLNKTTTRREFLLSVGRFTFRHWLTSSLLLGTGGALAWHRHRGTSSPEQPESPHRGTVSDN